MLNYEIVQHLGRLEAKKLKDLLPDEIIESLNK